MAIDEDAVLHGPQSGEEKLASFFDGHVMLFVYADKQFVSLRQAERSETKIFDRGLAVDFDFQIADKLIEREIDAMLFIDADSETELHLLISLADRV